LFLGYKGGQEDIVDSEGYFHTGDLGYCDKDGVIHFVEQISSLISFWMYEVAPSVLESRLLSHGSVVDAAVIAVPDKENGHVPRGFVVLKPGHEETEENLINFLESRLQDHERLRGGLYYIPQIPRDENWKVAKLLLQQFEPPSKGQDQGGQLSLCPLPDSLQAGSPRARRAAEAAVSLLRPGAAALPEEIFGMKSRSRRGSHDNVLDADHGKRLDGGSEEDFEEEAETRSPPPLLVVGRPAGENEREPTKAATKKKEKGEQMNRAEMEKSESSGKISSDDRAPLEYWVPVVVHPSHLEGLVGAHPGVAKVVVRGVRVPGLGGAVPRAYITLQPGVRLTPQQLVTWCTSNLDWNHRLRGGLVVAERLPEDLDTLDKAAVGIEAPPSPSLPIPVTPI